VNLKQLSDMLGLSQTTISRALNGYPEVNESTRRKVIEAAKRTGYRPNRAAQRLATGRSGSIGLVMPTAPGQYSDVHFGEFQIGLAEEALRHDFHFVITPSHPRDEPQAIRWMVSSGNVDGFYIAYMRERDERIAMALELGVPFIVHGRSVGIEADYPFLDVDNEGAFHDATRYLLELGHRRFALLNGLEDFDFAIRRRRGVERALGEAGLSLSPDDNRQSVMTDEQGFRGMAELLQGERRPTAVLCASTVLALGAVRAINQAGLVLGRDISLIAHDDVLPMLRPENFSVPLTTTRSSLRAAGIRIAERLISEIKAPRRTDPVLPGQASDPADAAVHELWKADFVIRSSTGPAPAE